MEFIQKEGTDFDWKFYDAASGQALNDKGLLFFAKKYYKKAKLGFWANVKSVTGDGVVEKRPRLLS